MIATIVALPLAVLVVWLVHRHRGRPLRVTVAEVGMVFGTLPWLYLTLRPDADGPGAVYLVPFRDLYALVSGGVVDLVTQLVGNLLVFATLGFFLPVRFAGFASVARVVAIAAVGSLAIEVTQLLAGTGRTFSVDDVILNPRWCGPGGGAVPPLVGHGRPLRCVGLRKVRWVTAGPVHRRNPLDKVFQVDLRGVVDLLSHHLYSSPRVYVRELLQNAVDAITARRNADPGAPARAVIEPPEVTGDGTLRITDTGIGLTESEVHVLLATIGRSSKRDDLGFARHEFLGQFGIGLLSCFLVADEVRVLTRSAREPDAPTVEWCGYADGRYRVALADAPRDEPGTTVTLAPRPGCEQWLTGPTVTKLAELYGSLLPIDVTIASPEAASGGASLGAATGGVVPGAPTGTRVTIPAPPWLDTYRDPGARRDALTDYAREVLGIAPFDIVDLKVPEAGLSGVAFILPVAANPASRATHRIYLKRMLLAEGAEGLLPEWAFFARCIVDSDELRPTASREALYEDDLLDSTREALGEQLRDWLMDLATTSPSRMRQFLGIHQLGVKALALYDLGMLRLVYRWLPFETSAGSMTLAEFRRKHDTIRYTQTVDEFRQLSAVAAAQGVGLVNGGYTYDSEILSRLPELDPEITVSVLDPTDLATHFDLLDPETELALRPFLAAAGARLDRLGCEVTIRAYDPPSLPALYLLDREAAHHAELRATREVVDELWSDVLSAFDTSAAPGRPQLVLNHRNPLVRRISALGDRGLAGLSVEALYGQALLLGHHPLRAADTALLNRSFLGLLDWAVHEPDTKENDQ